MDAALWSGVDRLVDRATLDGILVHKLGPLAAARRRAAGRPVERELIDEERAASFAMLSSSALLRRIREHSEGPLLLLKGPELALRYPPGGRRFGDIDILAPDAQAVHRTLERSGFEQVPESGFQEEDGAHHHLIPLRWPVVPLLVEVHAFPNWPPQIERPRLEEIIAAAVPSATGVDGLSAPHPRHHALLLAAHAWRHEPLQTLRDLLDVAAMAFGEDAAELEGTADEWGLARIWRSTREAIDALFLGAPRPASLRVWARHLERVRERTVLESHLQGVLSPFWAFPPRMAVAEALAGIKASATPMRGEGWAPKLRRIPCAIKDAHLARSKR